MSKKCYRFFGGLLNAQANWLNQMSQKGYRLVRTGRMLYEFEKCNPDEVIYCVEFIGEKSKENATDYADFLEDMGYKVFFKNINLNYSVGKVRWRPWAETGGRIATNATTFNRELLIVEKANDGKPFELHTSYALQVHRNSLSKYLLSHFHLKTSKNFLMHLLIQPCQSLEALYKFCFLMFPHPTHVYRDNSFHIEMYME